MRRKEYQTNRIENEIEKQNTNQKQFFSVHFTNEISPIKI